MNDQETRQFEAELRRTPPALVPDDFMARMRAARPALEPARREPPHPAAIRPAWRFKWTWLLPALGVVVAAIFLPPAPVPPPKPGIQQPLAAAGLRADDVQVDHELVSSFDVVAKLPGGEPVRFRCRQMRDQWVVTDKQRGVQIEESRPRLEVTPVRFETY